MNDIDDLRDAMHTTPDFEPRPLDLALVMRQGGRLRRRRRIATGAAAGVAVLAVLAVLVGGAQLTRPGPAADPVGGPPAATVPAPSDVASEATTQPPDQSGGIEVIGDVIDTGIAEGGAERVLWLTPLQSVPGVTFGVVTGRRAANGTLSSDILVNETEGSDRSEGFHAAEAAMEVNGRKTPAFGYYIGPATKITVRADGKTIVAEQAKSSEDPSIVVFWFAPGQVTPDTELTGLTAYDRKGRKLPAGNPSFGVG